MKPSQEAIAEAARPWAVEWTDKKTGRRKLAPPTALADDGPTTLLDFGGD
ncbi:MAG: hypothetical protein HYT80_00520 [Euryarchaeota archaeon]|nr:hypothetical protein [Euryarchaeota archaeon]